MHPRLLILLLLWCVAGIATAQPTPTYAPLTAAPVTTLRVRAQPSLTSETRAIIEAGTALTVFGKTSGGSWLEVTTPDAVRGWVFGEYVTLYGDIGAVPVTFTSQSEAQNLFSARVLERITQIYADGQALGNDPAMFSKVGDSITASNNAFHLIGQPSQKLGDYDGLQAVIDFYTAGAAPDATQSPFQRESLAAGVGWTSGALFDPKYADPRQCLTGETPLRCEYRVAKPAVALIMIGTNDVSYYSVQTYRNNISGIIAETIKHGIIPIISTLPPRDGYDAEVALFNQQLHELTTQFAVPLWDYHALMEPLPNRGLSNDGVHPGLPAHGYWGTADFRRHNHHSGYVMRNLSALQWLDAVWQSVIAPPENPVKTPTEKSPDAGYN